MRRAPRRLTVLASIDVAGFTRLIDEDERGTLVELARIRRRSCGRRSPPMAATVFKTMGDGALIEFQSVEDRGRMGDRVPERHGARAMPKREKPMNARLGVALADVDRPGQRPFRRRGRLRRPPAAGGAARRHRHYPFRPLAARRATSPRSSTAPSRRRSRAMTSPSRSGSGPPRGDATARMRRAADAAEGERSAAAGSPRRSGNRVPAPTYDRPSIAVLAFDNMSGDPCGRVPRRRHRRGDHRDAVAHPRLHRHRAELRLCL